MLRHLFGPTVVCLCLASLAVAVMAAGRRDRPEAAAAAASAGTGDKSVKPKSSLAVAALAKREKASQRAEQAFRQAMTDAERQCIEDLQAALKAALKAENLDEANAVRAAVEEAKARLTEVSGATGAAAKPGRDAARRLAEILTPGEWHHDAGVRGTYSADGTYRFATWPSDGRWEVVDSRTIRQREPNGAMSTVTVVVTADVAAALWVYDDGHLGWAKRKPVKH